MRGVAGHAVRVMGHDELAAELAAAFIAFRTERPGARYVEVPLDLLAEAARGRAARAPAHRAAERRRPPRSPPRSSGCATRSGPAIVAGGGAAGAADALARARRAARRAGAHDRQRQGDAARGPPAGARRAAQPARRRARSSRTATSCSRSGPSWRSPTSGARRCGCEGAVVRVDVDPRQAHMNQRAAVAVIGDAADALGLIVRGAARRGRRRRERAAAVRAALDAEWAAGATRLRGVAPGAARGAAATTR